MSALHGGVSEEPRAERAAPRPQAAPRDRLTAVAGLAAVALWVGGVALGPAIPDLFVDSGRTWLTFARTEQDGIVLSRSAMLLGDVAFIVFLSGLRVRLAAVEPAPGRWAPIAFGGGLLTAGMLICTATPVVAASAATDGLEPSAAQALGVLEYAFFVGAGFSAATLLLATGVLALGTGVLPRSFGYASMLLGALMTVLVGPVGFIAIVLGLPLWVLTASILCLSRRRPA